MIIDCCGLWVNVRPHIHYSQSPLRLIAHTFKHTHTHMLMSLCQLCPIGVFSHITHTLPTDLFNLPSPVISQGHVSRQEVAERAAALTPSVPNRTRREALFKAAFSRVTHYRAFSSPRCGVEKKGSWHEEFACCCKTSRFLMSSRLQAVGDVRGIESSRR